MKKNKQTERRYHGCARTDNSTEREAEAKQEEGTQVVE